MSAVAKLIPRPPARVDNMKRNFSLLIKEHADVFYQLPHECISHIMTLKTIHCTPLKNMDYGKLVLYTLLIFKKNNNTHELGILNSSICLCRSSCAV